LAPGGSGFFLFAFRRLFRVAFPVDQPGRQVHNALRFRRASLLSTLGVVSDLPFALLEVNRPNPGEPHRPSHLFAKVVFVSHKRWKFNLHRVPTRMRRSIDCVLCRLQALCTGLLLLFSSASVLAQTSIATGSIVGTISDTSGAVIVREQVTITNNTTGQEVPVLTNSAGVYNSGALLPGGYMLHVVREQPPRRHRRAIWRSRRRRPRFSAE